MTIKPALFTVLTIKLTFSTVQDTLSIHCLQYGTINLILLMELAHQTYVVYSMDTSILCFLTEWTHQTTHSLHYTKLLYTTLLYTTLHCTTLLYTTLHYTTLHYIKLKLYTSWIHLTYAVYNVEPSNFLDSIFLWPYHMPFTFLCSICTYL